MRRRVVVNARDWMSVVVEKEELATIAGGYESVKEGSGIYVKRFKY